MQATGYVRVSTDKQAEQGVSLEAQAGKIRAMAVVHDAELTELIVDTESAKNLNRPGMVRLLSRYYVARDRRRTESRSPSDPTRLSVATGARGENHEAGRSGLLARIVSIGLASLGEDPWILLNFEPAR